MKDIVISDAVKYIGADDKDLDLFESQYIVPNGVSYNSYVILDEKIAVMDTIDTRKTDEWKENLERVLDGRTPDYLVVSHLEPDHAGSIKEFADKYPEAKIVASAKAIAMLPQFFEIADLADRAVAVKEGEELSLGSHTLQFFMAPMVHWPEVMVEYEKSEKILFRCNCKVINPIDHRKSCSHGNSHSINQRLDRNFSHLHGGLLHGGCPSVSNCFLQQT